MNTPVMHIAIVTFIKLQTLSFVYREKVFLLLFTTWSDEPNGRREWSPVFSLLLCWELQPGKNFLQIVHTASEVLSVLSNVLEFLHPPPTHPFFSSFYRSTLFPHPSRQFYSLVSPSDSAHVQAIEFLSLFPPTLSSTSHSLLRTAPLGEQITDRFYS